MTIRRHPLQPARHDVRWTIVAEGRRGPANWYMTLSRGYQAGGFNIGAERARGRARVPARVPVEPGSRCPARASRSNAGRQTCRVLHAARGAAGRCMFQPDPGDPLSYLFYTDNAASGRNYGLEASAPGSRRSTEFGASLGLLQTQYLDYAYGGAQPRRPRTGACAGLPVFAVRPVGRRGGLDGARRPHGVDAFYFDTSHDQRSQPYALLNLKAGYAKAHWSAYVGPQSDRRGRTPCAASILASSRQTMRTNCTSSAATAGWSA